MEGGRGGGLTGGRGYPRTLLALTLALILTLTLTLPHPFMLSLPWRCQKMVLAAWSGPQGQQGQGGKIRQVKV